jgi:site-specific DNA recombinase
MNDTSAAIYCRISRDAEGLGLGVGRQEQDCRVVAESKGWAVHEVFVDNDISQTRKRGESKLRPAFERMCDAIRAGQVQAVIAFDTDRLFRDPAEAEKFLILCERVGMIRIQTVGGDEPIDVDSGEGLLMFRVKTAFAAEETRKTSKRLKAQQKALAESGAPKNGVRAFGYKTDGRTIQEDEAAELRAAVEGLLDGTKTLYSISQDWNKRGITSTRGKPFTSSHVRTLLLKDRNWGMRVYHGKVIGPGDWTPIITPEDGEQLVALLNNPHRRAGTGRPVKLFELSNLVQCGICGGKMRSGAGHRKVKADGTVSMNRYYLCRRADAGCGESSARKEELEAEVRDRMFKVIEQLRLNPQAGVSPKAAADLDTVLTQLKSNEKRLEELMEDYYASPNDTTRKAFLKTRDILSERIEGLRHQATQLQSSATVTRLLTRHVDPVATWHTLTFDERHGFFQAMVNAVTVVGRQSRSPRTWDSTRVSVTWLV